MFAARRRQFGLLLTISALSTLLVGCSNLGGSAPNQAEGSRAVPYGSLSELSGDSSLVIVGELISSQVVYDVDPQTAFTLNEIEVRASWDASNLGAHVDLNQDSVKPSDRIVVRQMGSKDSPVAVPLMETGRFYLLYLTPSQLPGEAASQYYITGADAGLYVSLDESSQRLESAMFEQVSPNDVDKLPPVIDQQDVLDR